MRVADHEGPGARAQQAVVWITRHKSGAESFEQLQILLWKDAFIEETAGTITTGPAMFVTLSTRGEIRVHADSVAFESSGEDRVFREAVRIRESASLDTLLEPEESHYLRITDASGVARPVERDKPRPILNFRSPGTFSLQDVDEDRQAITVTEGVYLSRGVPGGEDFLELRADAAVVFLPKRRETDGDGPEDTDVPEPAGLGTRRAPIGRRSNGAERGRDGDEQVMASALGDMEVEGVYLEGDVRMSEGPNTVRASRIYYDLLRDRAVILDAVVQTSISNRDLPLYLRAEEIRLLSQNEYIANESMLTTSEFHTPHYHVGASRVELTNRTPRLPSGRPAAVTAGSFRIRDATLNVNGVPVGYWPYISGSIETTETGIRGLRTGFSDDFGLEIETKWYLFNVLGLETPDGLDGTLALDYFSERGPAAGIDVDYERDSYYGLLRTYGIIDNEDEDNLGRDRETAGHSDVRGRVLLRHRQFLEDDWQLTLEGSYISDENFLEEYFESEFDNEKDQETLIYLKRQRDNWAFTALLQTRPLDFTTQTERYPDFAYFRVGGALGAATWHTENRLGMLRYRPKNQTFRELLREGELIGSGSVMRGDTRQEVGVSVDLGPWRLVPYGVVRYSAWDDSPEEGGVFRVLGSAGVRGSMYLSRLYPDSRSTMLDIDGIRHIIKPHFVAWVSDTNEDAEELFPFDETVEGIDPTSGVLLGVRQRWQTKRGPQDARRVVDVLTWDVQLGAFDDADGSAQTNGFASFSRPENSLARNHINSSVIYRVNDRTALLSELNYDMNDGEVDVLNVSVAVERPPRLSYLIGYRFIEEGESNLLGFDLNYRLTEKHTLALREAFDLERGRTLDFTIALIRRFPRWYSALSFALDEAEDDFGVSVSLWPEGLPQAALGSRRFTGLSTTTQLEND